MLLKDHPFAPQTVVDGRNPTNQLRLVVYADDVFTAPWNWHVFTTHVLGTYFTHAQTCNVTRVQSTTEWTASVHTLHMPKHVM